MLATGNEYTAFLFFFLNNKNAASAKDTNPAGLDLECSEGVEFILFIQVLEKNAQYFFIF